MPSARLTGRPGVAAVTAGPGVTNTITAVKNAQLAQSPVVLIGGAAPTVLQGRGALQDIDQMALMRPHVKWAHSVRRVRDIVPMLEQAFRVRSGGCAWTGLRRASRSTCSTTRQWSGSGTAPAVAARFRNARSRRT